MSDMSRALCAAIALLEEEGETDHAEELERLKEMFADRQGCPPQDASIRRVTPARCGNCDFTWPVMAMPAPLGETALAAIRFSQCPRCHGTRDIYLSAGG